MPARPGFLLEQRIPTPDGESPDDVRCFVFDGVVRVIQVDTPRTDVVQRRFYTPEWEPLEVRQGAKPLAPVMPRPRMLDELIRTAERIGAEFDFIRVDLYLVEDSIYFGEITPYPASGLQPFSDDRFDLQLGRYWKLRTR
jgi:hypothetical protein